MGPRKETTIERIFREVSGHKMPPSIRRILLRKTKQQVFYVVDDANGVIVIHTIWGARRGRGPKL